MSRVAILLLVMWSVGALAQPSAAQIDPFGGGTPVPDVATTPIATSEPGLDEDPVVLAVRESNPTTPVELTRALQAMINLGRYDEARRYLLKLLEGKPDDRALAEVHGEFGSAIFFRIARDEKLAPEGIQFARATMLAADNAARDPVRLQQLVRDLSDPAPGVRAAATRGLNAAGTDGVGPIVQALADRGRAREHANLRVALVQLGHVAVEPLIGTLGSTDEALLVQVIDTLGRLQARRATAYLVRPYVSTKSSDALRNAARDALLRIVGAVPTIDEAKLYLHQQATSFYSGSPPGRADHEDTIELWHWDPNDSTSVPRKYTTQEAALVVASQLASDLYQLDPSHKPYQRLFLSASLESTKLRGGLDAPLAKGPPYAEIASAGTSALEEVLARAMDDNHPATAIGAVEVLAEIGDASILHSNDGGRRPLSLALRSGDRRLRFEAAKAILKLDPQRPFPGSSHLIEVLGMVVASAGQRSVLIGHPRIEQARSLVGNLVESGIRAETAGTGRVFFQLATASPDYDLLLLSDAVDHPHFQEVLQMIRRDARTAQLPVGLIARQENSSRLQQLAELDPLTESFPWPYDATSLAFEIGRLNALAGRNVISPQEKIDQAVMALEALIRMAENPHRFAFYDVLGQQHAILSAVDTPQLTVRAIHMLGLLASSQAQRAIVDLASQYVRPLAHRQAAAQAFAEAVRRRGILLTMDQIRLQYDRYNRSEQLDQETQAVLGSILDTMEATSKQVSAAEPPLENPN